MKREKGSALLTVIIIAFVTITIGSALASLVMCNYKLRAFDKAITRAEYDSEGKMELVYFNIQKELMEAFSESYRDTILQVDSEVEEQREYYNRDNARTYVDYLSTFISPCYIKEDYSINDDIINFRYDEEFRKDCRNKMDAIISEEVNVIFGDKAKVITKNQGATQMEYELTIIANVEGHKTEVELKARIVVIIPSHAKVADNSYSIKDAIRISDWEKVDWGYL